MSTLVEAVSVVIPRHVLDVSYPGGCDAYLDGARRAAGVRYVVSDARLTAVSLSTLEEATAFVRPLEAVGLTTPDGRPLAIACVDEDFGPTTPAPWLRWRRHDEGYTSCWLEWTEPGDLAVPDVRTDPGAAADPHLRFAPPGSSDPGFDPFAEDAPAAGEAPAAVADDVVVDGALVHGVVVDEVVGDEVVGDEVVGEQSDAGAHAGAPGDGDDGWRDAAPASATDDLVESLDLLDAMASEDGTDDVDTAASHELRVMAIESEAADAPYATGSGTAMDAGLLIGSEDALEMEQGAAAAPATDTLDGAVEELETGATHGADVLDAAVLAAGALDAAALDAAALDAAALDAAAPDAAAPDAGVLDAGLLDADASRFDPVTGVASVSGLADAPSAGDEPEDGAGDAVQGYRASRHATPHPGMPLHGDAPHGDAPHGDEPDGAMMVAALAAMAEMSSSSGGSATPAIAAAAAPRLTPVAGGRAMPAESPDGGDRWAAGGQHRWRPVAAPPAAHDSPAAPEAARPLEAAAIALAAAAEMVSHTQESPVTTATDAPSTTTPYDAASGTTLLDALRAGVEHQGWRHSVDEVQDAVFYQVPGSRATYAGSALVDEESGLVRVLTQIPVRVPDQRRAAVVELVTRVNHRLPSGGFDFDYRTGEVRFRTSADLAGTTLPPAAAERLLTAGVTACEKVHDPLMQVIYGGAEPAELMKS